jgi:hypothetical protein
MIRKELDPSLSAERCRSHRKRMTRSSNLAKRNFSSADRETPLCRRQHQQTLINTGHTSDVQLEPVRNSRLLRHNMRYNSIECANAPTSCLSLVKHTHTHTHSEGKIYRQHRLKCIVDITRTPRFVVLRVFSSTDVSFER